MAASAASSPCVALSSSIARVDSTRNSALSVKCLRPSGLGGFGVSASVSPNARILSECRRTMIVAMASGESDSSSSELLKSIQDTWDKTDDKLAIGALGFAGLIVLWASTGLIAAIDKLPILPTIFELVGLVFTGWFIYRYLLFKPDREELLKIVDNAKAKITGSGE